MSVVFMAESPIWAANVSATNESIGARTHSIIQPGIIESKGGPGVDSNASDYRCLPKLGWNDSIIRFHLTGDF